MKYQTIFKLHSSRRVQMPFCQGIATISLSIAEATHCCILLIYTLPHSTSHYLCPTCWPLSNHTQNTSGDVAACGMIWAWPVICKSAVKGQQIMENLLEFTICDTLNLCGFTPTSSSLHTHALKTYTANLAVVDTYYLIYSTQLKQTR